MSQGSGFPAVQKKFGSLLFTGLALCLGGCVSLSLYQNPAIANKFDPQTAYAPFQPQEVYFFLSKDAFPQELRSIPVAALLTPWSSEWTYKELIREFQRKAAEVGANAVVFDHVETSNLSYGFLKYSGQATAYRLFRQDPSENVDLSTAPYGTQNPDLSRFQ